MPKTKDALPVELQRLDANHELHRMGLHAHTFFELVFIEQGAGLHRLGTELHAAKPGDLFIIPPAELHDCTNLGPSVTGWVLLFTHEALDGVDATSRAYVPHWPSPHPLLSPFLALSHRHGAALHLSEADRQQWSQRFATMAREGEGRAPGYRYGIQAYLNLLLLDLLRCVGTSAHPTAPPRSDPLLAAALDFIEREYAKPISAQDVARAVGRSTPHLTTAMRLRTGLTAGEWIAERRMAEARRLLIASELGLDDIADRAGYSGKDALSRAFRRAHRLSPASWRRAHRGKPPYT